MSAVARNPKDEWVLGKTATFTRNGEERIGVVRDVYRAAPGKVRLVVYDGELDLEVDEARERVEVEYV